MWNITITEKKITFPVNTTSLIRQVKEQRGILLFNNHLGGTHIAGFNPVIVIKEDELRYGRKRTKIDDPLRFIDSFMAVGRERSSGSPLMGYIAYDYKDRLEESGLYKGIRQHIFPRLYFAFFEYYFIFTPACRDVRIRRSNFSFAYDPVDIDEVVRKASLVPASDGKERRSFYAGTSLPKESFEDAVLKTIGYIRSGDIYQANITRSIYGETEMDEIEVGSRLYRSNIIDFGVFACIEGNVAISTSPERFFRVENGLIRTSPVKGTIEKKGDPFGDRLRKKALVTSGKNRAELAMIVDLLRNDMSRFCKKNTVRVKGFPVLKELDNVYHLVSDIEGNLEPGVCFATIIKAMFPGGSISGCPKIRACQLIEEIENGGRGVYTGCFGYLDIDGRMDFNIMIRSLFLAGNSFIFNTGGGITLLSDPEKEYEETIYKIKNIYDAINLEEVWKERYCLTEK
ncbi:MAG: anthranilate synthase component I family protein [Spirochaetales bacterium]|nr:anthranilate synthase component I family protein [Spirochaetales bacterium]